MSRRIKQVEVTVTVRTEVLPAGSDEWVDDVIIKSTQVVSRDELSMTMGNSINSAFTRTCLLVLDKAFRWLLDINDEAANATP